MYSFLSSVIGISFSFCFCSCTVAFSHLFLFFVSSSSVPCALSLSSCLLSVRLLCHLLCASLTLSVLRCFLAAVCVSCPRLVVCSVTIELIQNAIACFLFPFAFSFFCSEDPRKEGSPSFQAPRRRRSPPPRGFGKKAIKGSRCVLRAPESVARSLHRPRSLEHLLEVHCSGFSNLVFQVTQPRCRSRAPVHAI